jgi:hypothetical protein
MEGCHASVVRSTVSTAAYTIKSGSANTRSYSLTRPSGAAHSAASCPLQLGDPGSCQTSPGGAERQGRYPGGLNPGSALAAPAPTVRTISKMPVEFIASLVSQPPNLPGVLLGHVPKLADENPLGLEVKLPITEGPLFSSLE